MPEKGSGIDWDALLKRQEAAFAAVLEKDRDPERQQERLLARARQLSLKPDRDTEAGETVDCLAFTLSGESWAIELDCISVTLPLSEFTPVFCTPPFVLGITNVRGRIVSIVDLRRFFELPAVGLSDLNRVIVVGDGTMEFGVLADRVTGLRTIATRELLPVPDTFTGLRREFLAGITCDRLALLDMRKILADPRLVVHEEAG